jgi:ribose/xylose/arabinose/galactoside ABC-type transport system permease subunit
VVGSLTVGSVALGTVVGVAVGAVLSRFGRPALVETMRVGYLAKGATVRTWNDAKQAAAEVRAEALAKPSFRLTHEVEDLRREVAALRGQLARRPA